MEEFFLILLLIAAPLVAFFSVVGFYQEYRGIRNLPSAMVKTAAAGQVRLEGTVTAVSNLPLVSPISLTPCVWWQYTIEEMAAERRDYTLIEQGTSSMPFVFSDGTGECLLMPATGEISGPSHRQEWYFGSRYLTDPRDVRPFSGHKHYRFTETLLFEEEYVYLTGKVSLLTEEEWQTDFADRLKQDYRSALTLFEEGKPYEFEDETAPKLAQIRQKKAEVDGIDSIVMNGMTHTIRNLDLFCDEKKPRITAVKNILTAVACFLAFPTVLLIFLL